MSGKEIISCDHKTTESAGIRKLVVNCKRCGREHSIKNCLPGLILSLEDEYDIDSIIASDFMEEQYIGPGVDILTQIRDIAGEIESFSSRKQEEKKCMDCELRPSTLYPSLKRNFIEEPGIIYLELGRLADKAKQKRGCSECIKSLTEELEVLGERAKELKKDVLAEGFDIIG
ncbi:MAG: hypothetical protein ACOC55_05805 [Candidatus Natronoplasma sp.]